MKTIDEMSKKGKNYFSNKTHKKSMSEDLETTKLKKGTVKKPKRNKKIYMNMDIDDLKKLENEY